MKILITGATGFIGRATTRALVERGIEVRIASRPESSAGAVQGITTYTIDLFSTPSLMQAMSGADSVIHLAGVGSPSSPISQYGDIISTNVSGTHSVLQAAVHSGVRRVVMVSSSAVYGGVGSSILAESMPVMPASVYGATKLTAERIGAAYSSSGQTEAVSLRVFNVYGPGQWIRSQQHMLIPQLFRRIISGVPVTMRGDGNQTRDYVHIDDVVRAIVEACTHRKITESVINVGTGKPMSVRQILAAVSARLGNQPQIHYSPSQPGEIRNAIADTTLLRSSLGFVPDSRLLSFLNGIDDEELSQYGE